MGEKGPEVSGNLPVLDPGLARSLLEGNRDSEDIKDVQKSLGLKPTGTFDLKTKQTIEKRLGLFKEKTTTTSNINDNLSKIRYKELINELKEHFGNDWKKGKNGISSIKIDGNTLIISEKQGLLLFGNSSGGFKKISLIDDNKKPENFNNIITSIEGAKNNFQIKYGNDIIDTVIKKLDVLRDQVSLPESGYGMKWRNVGSEKFVFLYGLDSREVIVGISVNKFIKSHTVEQASDFIISKLDINANQRTNQNRETYSRKPERMDTHNISRNISQNINSQIKSQNLPFKIINNGNNMSIYLVTKGTRQGEFGNNNVSSNPNLYNLGSISLNQAHPGYSNWNMNSQYYSSFINKIRGDINNSGNSPINQNDIKQEDRHLLNINQLQQLRTIISKTIKSTGIS